VRSAIEAQPKDARERIHEKMTTEPVCALIDRARIEQVVGNLVSNAVKYSPADSPIEIELAVHEETVVLSVADRGTGISDEDQKHLFEPFRRFHTDVPGIGLGLFMSRGIVESHGGAIEVASKPGRGSTFTVRLPLERGKRPSPSKILATDAAVCG
jgi:signal transduction histidine kinase